jgi:7,8-dihydropterin-6-yl-methyl-4-(beta-D-ribofuranosyl)aminobenzene 5'-phosphate synthase
MEPLTIRVIYDNYDCGPGPVAGWGFSCLIEGTEKTILFDTGAGGNGLLRNMKKMEIDPHRVELVFLSHEHVDHTGGLFAFIERNPEVPVVMHGAFSRQFVARLETSGAKPVKYPESARLCDGVYTSGTMDSPMIPEHSLAVDSPRGLLAVAGCSHPGIVGITERFRATLKRNVYAVLGGFHLMEKPDEEVRKLIADLKKLGVARCGASHCTGNRAIELFRQTFGAGYIEMGAGRVIEFKNRENNNA